MPSAYKEQGAYEGKKMIEISIQRQKNKENRTFAPRVPRAYDSLNPALLKSNESYHSEKHFLFVYVVNRLVLMEFYGQNKDKMKTWPLE